MDFEEIIKGDPRLCKQGHVIGGSSPITTVYKSIFRSFSSPLTTESFTLVRKCFDLDHCRSDINQARRHSKKALSHPNLLFSRDHYSKVDGTGKKISVIMPLMSIGSVHSIIPTYHEEGLDETSMAVILKETLKGLCFLHSRGYFHRDVKPGNILLDGNGSVRLSDFSVSSTFYDPNWSRPSISSLCPLYLLTEKKENSDRIVPYWIAPELVAPDHDNAVVLDDHGVVGVNADIWAFGVTAMELAHGRPPLSCFPAYSPLLRRIGRDSWICGSRSKKKGTIVAKKFSEEFQEMVVACLAENPFERPTADQLLEFPFFKNCVEQGPDFLVEHLQLNGLPPLECRYGDGSEEPTFVKYYSDLKWKFNPETLEFDPIFSSRQLLVEELENTSPILIRTDETRVADAASTGISDQHDQVLVMEEQVGRTDSHQEVLLDDLEEAGPRSLKLVEDMINELNFLSASFGKETEILKRLSNRIIGEEFINDNDSRVTEMIRKLSSKSEKQKLVEIVPSLIPDLWTLQHHMEMERKTVTGLMDKVERESVIQTTHEAELRKIIKEQQTELKSMKNKEEELKKKVNDMNYYIELERYDKEEQQYQYNDNQRKIKLVKCKVEHLRYEMERQINIKKLYPERFLAGTKDGRYLELAAAGRRPHNEVGESSRKAE